ncbi:MAG TPA: alpha-amylase/4-alpha-glucanotransferase domain-containing protein [Gemmatimonadales bacterium]|jgi:alpha-amylase|nr:alpha-amylase/4-alpha-glucanotransferase domain-containing protein [Gemmatimonadales bacterium]
MNAPLRFCFGLHLHQPVGNFDWVFEQHLEEVYRPLLNALMAGEVWPVAMHISGPLLDWLEAHAPAFVDEIGEHVAADRLELLAAGHDEPILAVLSRADRLEQIARHREHLRQRLGADARGLWLTERVWEPSLPEDLAEAGIRFVLVDDRHFRVTGFPANQLHRHFTTETGGKRVGVFPIDEKLRYLVPFRPPAELAEYFRTLRSEGADVAILADDGEKFGGWPGTRKWVYDDGWMNAFAGTLRELRDRGEIALTRFEDALERTPSGGLAYLPSASYREMEGWSLPPDPARALLRLERDWGDARLAGAEGGLLRGGHWRHFLAKYPESNRMHKAMLALSALSRDRGDPAEARRAIGRAQCNDAYWHGVFGGLYLPHLRSAIWTELARAEAVLRAGEAPAVEQLDFDGDGRAELWVHADTFSALVAPARGGAVEMLVDFASGVNRVDVMTRHREAYHEPLDGTVATGHGDSGHDATGAPSIHDGETELAERPATDRETRAWFVDRVLAATASREDFIAGTVPTLRSWSDAQLNAEWRTAPEHAAVHLFGNGLTKTIRFDRDGTVTAEWEWDATVGNAAGEGWFSTEISIAGYVDFEAPDAALWSYPIETVAKSEKGFDRTVQGTAAVFRWPLAAGRAKVTARPT